MSVELVWIIVIAILIVLAFATRDFKTASEEEAKKHTAAHEKHKPVWKEPY